MIAESCTDISNQCLPADPVCNPAIAFITHQVIDRSSNSTDKIVFISPTTTNGQFGGIDTADGICQSDAIFKGFTGTFKAFLVAGAGNIRTASITANAGDGQVEWVLQANKTYVQEDQTTVIQTSNANALWNFPLQNPASSSAGQFWSGMNNNWTTGGTPNSNLCDTTSLTSWTTASFGTPGVFNSLTNAILKDSNNLDCTTMIHFLCIQQ